jgi:uncharacterized UPF0160 family protein
VLYALYADLGGSWRIQAVPLSPNSFDSRKKLPADWCGLRDAELSVKVILSNFVMSMRKNCVTVFFIIL